MKRLTNKLIDKSLKKIGKERQLEINKNEVIQLSGVCKGNYNHLFLVMWIQKGNTILLSK